MVNKFLWMHSGTERYMFDAARELRDAGHEIAYFGMDDPRNAEIEHRPYHVSPIDYRRADLRYRLRHAARIVGGTVYSFEARRKMAELIRAFRPDVAHLHLFNHHISPSILHALRDAGVPAVRTIHDFKLVCPNYSLYLRRRGEICERCLGGSYHPCVLRRCVKDSLPGSVLAAGAQYLHRALRIDERHTDLFLCPTQFVADKLQEGDVPRRQLRRVPLTLDLAAYLPREDMDDYIVYAGRLLRDKGVGTLIRALAKLPRVRLLVAGDGEERGQFESLACRLGASNVEFLGFRPRDELARIIGKSRFLVMPSEAYETCGLAVWEAFALERPVVVSRRGGLPESVREGVTGLTFEPGNVDALAGCIEKLYSRAVLSRRMGKQGRAWVEKVQASHLDSLTNAYREARGLG
jgi:glycosyltransferase involved in cell wall biosynthesis